MPQQIQAIPPWDTDEEIQEAILTPKEEDIIKETLEIARAGNIKEARRVLLPLLESICERGLEIPFQIEAAYAEITLLERQS